MRAEILAVGTELLLGDIVNSNAAWIGTALTSLGVDCYRHTTVGDNVERIAEAMDEALSRADAVIVTGGLGPTQDDVTREAIAHLTGRRLLVDEAVERSLRDRFAALGREMAATNLRQAEVPEGARVIETSFGTAPGLIVEDDRGLLIALPGVPREMHDMMERAVLPELASRTEGVALTSPVVRLAGICESSAAQQLAPLWDSIEGATIAFLAGGGEVRVRVTASDRVAVDTTVDAVRATFGATVVGTDDDTLEAVVGAMLLERGWTLGLAESLTAGMIGARLVDVPGASAWFRGAVTAYDEAIKTDLLDVTPTLLSEEGPVSEPVASAMAIGARERFGATVGLAATGVAGPDPHGGRDPGTVVVAIDGPHGTSARSLRLPGDRATVRRFATGVALNLARLYLMEALG